MIITRRWMLGDNWVYPDANWELSLPNRWLLPQLQKINPQKQGSWKEWISKRRQTWRGGDVWRRAGLSSCPCTIPPDRKVMHEPTEQRCSGESAGSHLESIRRLHNKLAKKVSAVVDSLVLPGRTGAACTPALRVAPGHRGPYLNNHYTGSMRSLTLIQLKN